VTVNGYTYRTTIAVMGGKYMVGVSAEHRAGAGVGGGDVVDVDIELDDAPRTVEIPPGLATALAKDKAAKVTFDGLSYSNQRRHADGIASAKTRPASAASRRPWLNCTDSPRRRVGARQSASGTGFRAAATVAL